MQPVDFLVPIELIDALNALHIDQPAIFVVQISQPVVKALTAEEKAALYDVGVC